MMLALLALALPTATLATNVSTHSRVVPCFDFRSGTFERGTGHPSLKAMRDIPVVETDNTISLDVGTLPVRPSEYAPRNPEVICFRFSSGTVTVKNPAGERVFTDNVKGGFISTLNSRVNVNPTVVAKATVLVGNENFAFEFNHHTMTTGDPPVFGFNVPSILDPGWAGETPQAREVGYVFKAV